MRRFALTLGLFLPALVAVQGQGSGSRPRTANSSPTAALAVRRVVLYKSGVGYFEHIGKVRGSQGVTIDFTSGQLDDVLKSLTALDLGGGSISGISYNSERSSADRLGAIRLPVGERTTLPELLGALRGARLEVLSDGRTVSGRLLGIDRRVRGNDTIGRDEISLVSDTGSIETVELTPAVRVRLVERETADSVSAYLGVLASTRAADRRRLTIATTGAGERDLLVSYISEVPIWKTNYRIVLGADRQPLLQGWAIVDNTTGVDWGSVELSLIAGAPQSFIQRMSQPVYGRRPVVAMAVGSESQPQTHDATLAAGSGSLHGIVRDTSGAVLPGVTVRLLDEQRRTVTQALTDGMGAFNIPRVTGGTYRVEYMLAGFQTVVNDVRIEAGRNSTDEARMPFGSLEETVTVSGQAPTVDVSTASSLRQSRERAGAAALPSMPAPETILNRMQEAPIAATPADRSDMFEYRLNAPISVRSGQSALVPIVNQPIQADKVTLWSGRFGARPLHAIWLTNTTSLTLDGGSFTVLDGATFAGEGLIDPLKPHEKRLLSYAVDLGVQIDARHADTSSFVRRLVAHDGLLIEHREQRSQRVYTVRNNDTTPRHVVIEHARRSGWTLAEGVEPAETTAAAYRFAVDVPPAHTSTLAVMETEGTQVQLQFSLMNEEQLRLLVKNSGDNAGLVRSLEPIRAKQAEISAISHRMDDLEAAVEETETRQERLRQNLAALKDTSEGRALVKHYATELLATEELIAKNSRDHEAAEHTLEAAKAELNRLIERLVFDVSVSH